MRTLLVEEFNDKFCFKKKKIELILIHQVIDLSWDLIQYHFIS